MGSPVSFLVDSTRPSGTCGADGVTQTGDRDGSAKVEKVFSDVDRRAFLYFSSVRTGYSWDVVR